MVTVTIQTESRYPIARKRITKTVQDFLASKIESDADVSIMIVGDRKIHALNKTYRQKDYPTNVLSFPLQEMGKYNGISFVGPPDDILHLGDIVVSYPQAVREAGEENKLVDDVIEFLILHGLNHLLGIHHPE
ncbi:MAG: rRNA maturation RNase YbeY [Candidatus Gottesmanbacteria bacterium]